LTDTAATNSTQLDRPRLTVDLDALARNYARLRIASGTAETSAVVKADAYGLGLEAVVRRLVREGCTTFFVANIEEGAQTRALAPTARIYVFNGLMPGDEARHVHLNLSPILNAPWQLDLWLAARRLRPESLPPAAPAALFVDTGMNRLGFTRTEADEVLNRTDLAGDEVDLIMSHFACAPTPDHPMNAEQIAKFGPAFAHLRTRFTAARASLANSAGIFLGPKACLSITRPGVALYGGAPWEDRSITMDAVAILEAPILQVSDLQPGDTVGYGADRVIDRPTRAATVALGYGDGFLRATAGRGYGMLRGQRAPILGRVSMDLITVDITDHAQEVTPGAWIEFLGPNALLDDQAEAASTANYEFLTRLSPRCVRSYRGATS